MFSPKRLLAAALFLAPGLAFAAPAFPGAAGYGAVSIGGRGGSVYEVTTLADAGPGSLRACVEATGPRTCVFRVAGTIELKSSLKARASYLTIAGQTAPGAGVQVKHSMTPTLGTHMLYIGDSSAATPEAQRTHDVIVRHVRFRPGFDNANPAFRLASSDAIGAERAYNLIFDHVDAQWGADENYNSHQIPSRFITVSNSILAEGLRDHSKGGLTCSDGTGGCHSITWVGNLLHSNDNRNVSLPPDGRGGCVDFVDNVVSNQGVRGLEIWDNHGGARVNVVGNTFKRGPSTGRNGYPSGGIYNGDVNQAAFANAIHANDNVAVGLPLLDPTGVAFTSSPAPLCPLSVASAGSAAALTNVYARAGAWPRDTLGARFVSESRNGGGTIVYSTARKPNAAGVWPVYAAATPPADGDRDGMPNAFEANNGLNPANAADRNLDRDGDGFTELEEYLDARHREVTGAAAPPASAPAPSPVVVPLPKPTGPGDAPRAGGEAGKTGAIDGGKSAPEAPRPGGTDAGRPKTDGGKGTPEVTRPKAPEPKRPGSDRGKAGAGETPRGGTRDAGTGGGG